MEIKDSLCNQLLIAMPGMSDPNFNSTVTLICEHNTEGALGIVINRPLDMQLGGLFEQLAIAEPDLAQSWTRVRKLSICFSGSSVNALKRRH